MGNQSDFDLRREANGERRSASVSQIRERTRPPLPHLNEEDRDPVNDWDTHHAGSLQLPATHKPHGVDRADLGDVATSAAPQGANRTATRDRAEAFSLEAGADADDETEAHGAEPPDQGHQDLNGREGDTTAAAPPVASLHRDPAPKPRRVPRRRAGVLAVGLAGVATALAGLILLSGHNAHHTAASAGSTNTRSALLINPLASTDLQNIKPAVSTPKVESKEPRKAQHHVNRGAPRSRHHRTTVPRAHPVTHAAVTVQQAPVYTTPTRTTQVYTAPVQTPPASVTTPATDSSSSSPATSSSGYSSGAHTSSSSSPAKRPVFGADGTLAPGSSPDG
jgi:hypothetical protein